MAKKFLVNIDLGGNQLLSARIQNGTSAPTAYGAGQLWYDTTNNQLKVYDGSSFVQVGGGVTSLNSLTGGLNIYGTTNQIAVNASSSSITLSLPSTISITTACATNFYGTFNGNATTTSQTNFSALTISGSNVATQAYVTGLGYQTSSGSVAYATTAGGVTGATSSNTNSAYVVRDASGRAQFTDPSAAQDAATKNYVDTVAQGLNAHDAVLVTTTATLPANYANGTTDQSGGLGIGATLTASANGTLTIDNVLLTVNDRVLVKNQTSGLQNGIYYVSASGAAGSAWTLTRATDADNSIAGEMANGDFVFVSSGSVGSGTGWTLNSASTSGTQARTIKIGTDIVTYTQFSGQGTYTAGNGITISGNTFSVKNGVGLAFSSSSLTFDSGTTAQAATGVSGGAYTYATQKQSATISGNSSATSFAISHNLNSRDVNVQVYQTSATPDTQYAEVEVDIVRTSASVVTVSFATAPATGTTYNVVIVG